MNARMRNLPIAGRTFLCGLTALFFFLLILLPPALPAAAQDLSGASEKDAESVVHLKPIVAVTRFENRSSYTSGGGESLTQGLEDQLTNALTRSGAFVVLERTVLDDVLAEQDLAQRGMTARSQSARISKMTGAQILIMGSVTEFDLQKSKGGSGIGIGGLRLGSHKQQAHVGLIIKLVNATSGEVVASQRVEGNAKAKGRRLGINIGGVSFDSDNFQETPLGKATQIAIDRAVAFIAENARRIPFQARVVQVKDGRIAISAGKRNNVAVGMRFMVMSVGNELKDPFTGELLGYDQTELGEVSIERIFDRFSFVRPVSDLEGVKVGDFAVLR
ncbi:MAG: hypothetical protein D6757_06670 [Alphaproteobacteria bacterium]|nr:MAG: hypothetical protein D6757_06670 [Alphaproteobacteria bacterium]